MKLFFASIIKPHSIHGEVEVDSNEYDLVSVGLSLYTEDGIIYKIKGIKRKPLRIVLFFEGISTRTIAETLRGTRLFIETDDVPESNDNSFYLGELIGMNVIDIDNAKRGVVIDYYETKAHGIFEIEIEGNKRISVPFVGRYIIDIDRENKEIKVCDFDMFLE